MDFKLRDALPEETYAVSELMLRSKASHGYDATFLEACRAELQMTPERLHTEQVRVAARERDLLGISALAIEGRDAELTALFVEPVHLGLGVGRALWVDAIEACVQCGVRTLQIASDPFALAWYVRQGAVQVGDVPSESIPGRRLPLLVLALSRLD